MRVTTSTALAREEIGRPVAEGKGDFDDGDMGLSGSDRMGMGTCICRPASPSSRHQRETGLGLPLGEEVFELLASRRVAEERTRQERRKLRQDRQTQAWVKDLSQDGGDALSQRRAANETTVMKPLSCKSMQGRWASLSPAVSLGSSRH